MSKAGPCLHNLGRIQSTLTRPSPPFSPPTAPGRPSRPRWREHGKIQAEIAQARSVIEQCERSHQRAAPLRDCDVRQKLTQAAGLVGMLAEADRADRADLYLGPSASPSATKNKLHPGGNWSMPGWSYVVAGEGFEPSTFGL